MMKNRNEMKSTSTDYSDFGLGLNMQAESPEFEKTRAFPFNQYQFTPSAAGGGGRFFWDISGVQACGTDEIFYPSGTAGGGGGMAVSEKSLFTASQLHELERQQIIHKYMMASIPVPHELMFPFSRTSSLAGAPQSKMCVASGSGVDSRFSSSKLDPEPWRCRRTDGKKWRCSRNAAADQRYCERHSHKNKPRSRKHVEAKTSPQSLQAGSTSQYPVTAPGLGTIPYDHQARRMRGGSSSSSTVPVSSCSYRQQMQHISSRLDLMNRDHTHHQKNVSQSEALHKQDFKSPVQNRFEFSTDGEYSNSLLPSKMTSFQETPPHFIDAWEQEGIKGLSPSSLTLSMSWNRNDEGNENDRHFAVGINESERPGGPLGEALCLGTASNSNFQSPSDYTYTRNSFEDGSHAFKFIR